MHTMPTASMEWVVVYCFTHLPIYSLVRNGFYAMSTLNGAPNKRQSAMDGCVTTDDVHRMDVMREANHSTR